MSNWFTVAAAARLRTPLHSGSSPERADVPLKPRRVLELAALSFAVSSAGCGFRLTQGAVLIAGWAALLPCLEIPFRLYQLTCDLFPFPTRKTTERSGSGNSRWRYYCHHRSWRPGGTVDAGWPSFTSAGRGNRACAKGSVAFANGRAHDSLASPAVGPTRGQRIGSGDAAGRTQRFTLTHAVLGQLGHPAAGRKRIVKRRHARID